MIRKDLRPGDVLATADGSAVVVRVEPTGVTARVFNLHVEDLHNYHVGGVAWARVHNDCVGVVYRSGGLTAEYFTSPDH